jgi:hypothetical protein
MDEDWDDIPLEPLTPGERDGYSASWYGGLGVPDGWDAYGRIVDGHAWSPHYAWLSPGQYCPRKFKPRAIPTPPPQVKYVKPPPAPPPPEPPPPRQWHYVETEVKSYEDNWQKVEMTKDEIIRHERLGMWTRSTCGYKQHDDHLWRWLNYHLAIWSNEHPMRIR